MPQHQPKSSERAAREILEKFGKVHPRWLVTCTKVVERAIAESQAWIPVEEKLPEHRDEQILTVTRTKRIELQSAVFWRYLPDSYDPVTHWAHLLDPPKGNENV